MRRLLPLPLAEDLDDQTLMDEARPPQSGRPFVRFNFVSFLDGVATLHGTSAGVSTPPDHRLFGLLRAPADAIVVGAGTVAKENYHGDLVDPGVRAWRRSQGLSERPVTVVLSASAGIDPRLEVFSDAPAPVWVLVGADADAGRVHALRMAAAEVIEIPGQVTPQAIVEALAQRGLRHLHCEGGPHIFEQFVTAGVLDSFCISYSPALAPGQGGPIDPASHPAGPLELTLHRIYEQDSTLMSEYRRGA